MLPFSFVKKQNGKNIIKKFLIIDTCTLTVWSPVNFQQHGLYGWPSTITI